MNAFMKDETVYYLDALHPKNQGLLTFGWIKMGEPMTIKNTNGHHG